MTEQGLNHRNLALSEICSGRRKRPQSHYFMKKALSTAGIVAAGALTVQTAQAQEKPWSVSATIRGFYDDNINTTPSGLVPGKQESYGFELRPEASYTYSTGQFEAEVSYLYSMKYYENRSNSADHRHNFGATASYRFSPRLVIDVSEEFVIGQESEILDPATGFTTRSTGNNIRNSASIGALYEMTRQLAVDFNYSNYFIDYAQTGLSSRSALLDRMEHRVGADLRWAATETTVGLIGYSFGVRDQTANDLLVPGVTPDARDSRSHYVYLGAEHDFTSQLQASVRAGVQYTEFPNLRSVAAAADDDTVNPYVDANVTYKFAERASAQLGVSHERAQTDLFGLAGGAPTLDSESTRVYSTISYGFTAKITGALNAQLQHNSFNGGASNNSKDVSFLFGANLDYDITEYLTAQAGYAFDRLDSDTALRSFTRNRVYLGLKATF